MELTVHKITGEKTSRKIKLDDSIFGIEPNDHAIYLDTRQHLANKRQGTSSTKERAEITGSTRKIKRQKGTGTARAGDIKNPMFRGGGRAFGPRPRNYHFKLNRKLKQLARKSALAYKAKDKGIIVLEDFDFNDPKTRSYVSILNSFELGRKKSLMLVKDKNENLYLASRNLQNAKVSMVHNLNTYDILNANSLLIQESSLKEIESIFGDEK
ncbi:MAG: 50S ribosomal protein L4 [Bacteroidales bacterium]|mgnify:CR=1 FL=1|nr:50S ribosomal protein L4 [Bacteroidales bacterium]MCF8398380.1 50S ribosomal protein L4 [Bacteroidales bacterium]